MPLTLMLVALGRHIPAFGFFDILFGDRPALSAPETFYQRILHGHVEEAIDHAEDLLDDMPLAQYFDDVVLEGLRLAAADMDRGLMDRHALGLMAHATITVANALAAHVDELTEMAPNTGFAPFAPRDAELTHAADPVPCANKVICLAARGPLDPAVATLLLILLQRRGCEVEQIDRSNWHDVEAEHLASGGTMFCVAGLFGPRAYRRVAQMQRQIQARLPGTPVVVVARRAGKDEQPARGIVEPERTLGNAIELLVAPAIESARSEPHRPATAPRPQDDAYPSRLAAEAD
jgi:hypothetical protein